MSKSDRTKFVNREIARLILIESQGLCRTCGSVHNYVMDFWAEFPDFDPKFEERVNWVVNNEQWRRINARIMQFGGLDYRRELWGWLESMKDEG